MTIAPEQEIGLLTQCLEGSRDAWRRFIENYSALVYYVIRKVLLSKCPEAAAEEIIADLHNDVFVSLIDKNGRKLRQYEGKNGCSISTWIRVIAVRTTIDFLRRRKDLVSLSDEDSEKAFERRTAVSPPGLDGLETREEHQALISLIDQLSAKDRLFIRLLYYEETPAREIARIMNTTPNAVYSRGNYLREKLRNALENKRSKKKR